MTMFDGFVLEDFEAYLPEKWSSNMFTLPRRRVKDKLESLGQLLLDELAQAGLRLEMHLSDDHPSLWNKKKVDTQWLFFSRDEDAKKKLSEVIDTEKTLAATLADPTPLYRHVFIGVSVDQGNLEVGLRLHHDAWVDRKNLVALVSNPDSNVAFDALRSGLSDGFVMGLVGGELTPVKDLDPEGLRRITAEFDQKKGWLFLGMRMSNVEAAGMGEEARERIRDFFRSLVPVYRFFAWSPSNDAVSIDSIVADRHKELEASQAALEKERHEREIRRREEEEKGAALRKETEERARAEQAWRERERAMRRAAARAAAVIAEGAQARASEERVARAAAAEASPAQDVAPEPRPEARKETPRPPAPRPVKERPERKAPAKAAPSPRAQRVSKERMDDIHVGDGVLVQKGFLQGRFGIVQSVDEKGDLKVVFGALTSRVPRSDVEGRGPAPDRDDPAGRRRK